MNRDEFLGKLQMCYFGDRSAFNEIVSVYDDLQNRWDSLKEWLENLSEGKLINGEYTQQVGIRIEYVLDKMNELEGDDKVE